MDWHALALLVETRILGLTFALGDENEVKSKIPDFERGKDLAMAGLTTPAKAGAQKTLKKLDFRFRGNDSKGFDIRADVLK